VKLLDRSTIVVLHEIESLTMNKIRKGDQVIVITGKYKGQKGEVLRVANDRVFVQNIALIKRHTKPNPQINQPGGIVEREASIHVSNVMLFNAAANKGDRVGFKVLDNGRKVRTFRSSGEVVDA
jgi:large subunit ribosomal protein L24